MQPEISRLQQMHQRELAEVESQAMAQERQLNEDIQRQLLSMVEEEKAAARDRQRQLLSEAQTRLAEEVQRLEEAHRQKFSHMQVDMDAEIDRFRSALELRNERDRRKGQQEIKITQEHTQSLLSEIQAKHSQEMTNLFKDHQAQVTSNYYCDTFEWMQNVMNSYCICLLHSDETNHVVQVHCLSRQ